MVQVAGGPGTMRGSGRSEFSAYLNRICGAGALAVLLAIIVLVVLERWGVPKELIGRAMVSLAFALFATVGIISFTADPFEFQLAARRIPAAFAGMALAAEWSSAALLLGAPASLFISGYDGRLLLVGLTGGYVLTAVLIGPFVQNSGASTLPGFMAARYGGVVRVLAGIVLLVCSLLFLTGLVQAAVPVAARALAISWGIAAYVIIAVALVCALAGGLAGLTATQVAQYTALLVGSGAVFVTYAAETYDAPTGAPYDPISQALEAVVQGLGLAPAPSPRSIPFRFGQTLNQLEMILCLTAGTASLPHIVMHSSSTANMGEARRSAVWSLFFIALLTMTLPTYMMFSSSAGSYEQSTVISALVPLIALTSMLAAASALLLTLANSLRHDAYCSLFPSQASSKRGVMVARALMLIAAALVAYAVAHSVLEPLSMLVWAFSLAAAGLFPALVLGIWWSRTSAVGAIVGIVCGFGVCLFYLVVTRYFPQVGLIRFGMVPLVDTMTGHSLVDAAPVLADPRWRLDVPASAANPLASKVGWFNVSNAACGLFGLAVGFFMIAAVSLLGKKPSARSRVLLAGLRAPRGNAAA
jgi:cation/acetate symporter